MGSRRIRNETLLLPTGSLDLQITQTLTMTNQHTVNPNPASKPPPPNSAESPDPCPVNTRTGPCGAGRPAGRFAVSRRRPDGYATERGHTHEGSGWHG